MPRRSTLLRILIWGGLAILTSVVALDYFDVVPLNSPDTDRWPVRGLDISHHQGPIDFAALRHGEDHLRFIFIKATEGGDWVDDRFETNWRGARRQGFAVGAYHFFTPCRPGQTQADNFIRTVPVATAALPPVADAEMMDGCKDPTPGMRGLKAELLAFLEVLERHYGQVPIVYVTLEFYEVHMAGVPEFGRYPLWVRSIGEEPPLPDSRAWTYWQYSTRGRVAGISGRVDRNVFAGSETALTDEMKSP